MKMYYMEIILKVTEDFFFVFDVLYTFADITTPAKLYINKVNY